MPGTRSRDFDFAKKYNLEITRVVSDKKENGVLKEAYTGNGVLINSEFLNNLEVNKAKEKNY